MLLKARLFGISRMEWWNGIVEWNTGMTFYPENLTFGGASTSMEVNIGTSHNQSFWKNGPFFPQLPAKLYPCA